MIASSHGTAIMATVVLALNNAALILERKTKRQAEKQIPSKLG